MQILRKFLVATSILLAPCVGFAQQGQQAFNPLGQATRTVSSSSARVALPTSSGPTSWLFNDGSVEIFFKYGDSTVVATTSDYPLPAGACVAYGSGQNTNIAAITSSSTSTLRITQGIGMPAGACGGSGSGGGAVTVADGADTAQGTTTDSACATDNGTCTEIALLKRGNQRLTSILAGLVNTIVLQAGENHVGEVGGNILPITSTLVTSNNTVTTGKAIGPLQTLANAVRVSGSIGASGTSGMIQSVVLTFKDAIGTVPMDVYFFNANPTGSTCTDNTTFALVDADRDKVIFVAHVTDFTASNTAAIGQAMNQAAPFGIASATSIFACVVTRGSAAITGTANASLITRILRN